MTEHHARVRKLPDDYGLTPMLWRLDCSCGQWQMGSTWHSVFSWAFDHVSQHSGKMRVREQTMSKMTETVDLLPLVKTKLAWDLLDHQDMNTWLPRLGLVPAPDDMDELEHAEAHARAAKVVPLGSLAETYAAVVADIQTAYFAHESGNDSGDHEEFNDMVFRIIRSSLFAILGEFLADGVIGYGPAFTRVSHE